MSYDPTSLLVPQDRSAPIHEAIASIQRRIGKPPFSSSAHMLKDGETKFLVHRFPDSFVRKHPKIDILTISDVQFGAKGCRVDKLVEYRDWILAEPNRFCLWPGDMIDAWRVGSPGSGYDNWFRPDAQLYKFCDLMAPLVPRVLGFVGGNHERRGLAGGVDLGSLMAWALGLPYSSGAQMISVFYGQHQPFKIYMWHGAGASRTAGARINMTLRAVPNDEAHVYVSGHIHWSHLYPGWHVRRNYKTNRAEAEPYFVLSASSFLEFWGGYGETAGMTYNDLMMPSVSLQAKGTFDAIFRAHNISAVQGASTKVCRGPGGKDARRV